MPNYRPAEREYCCRNEIVVLLVIASVIYFYRFICLCPHDIGQEDRENDITEDRGETQNKQCLKKTFCVEIPVQFLKFEMNKNG